MALAFFEGGLLWPLTITLLLLPVLYLTWNKSDKLKKYAINGVPNGVAQNGKVANGDQNVLSVNGDQSLVRLGEVKVSKILVHPIKSCRGTSVPEARYTPEGLENDRKWCIIDADTHAVLTARELASLVLIIPRLELDASSPYGGKLVVSVPKGTGHITFWLPIQPTLDMLNNWPIINDCLMFKMFVIDGYVCQALSPSERSPSEVLSEYLNHKVLLVMKGPAPRDCPPTLAFPELKANSVFQDAYPLLVASEESLVEVSNYVRQVAQIGEGQPGRVGGMDQERWKDGNLEIERFRPNIVLKGAGIPFAEDMFREVIIGPEVELDPANVDKSRVITLVSKCTRCLLPNVDTNTGVRDAAVPYKVLMKFRAGLDPAKKSKPCFGCNGVPGASGIVKVGDYVTVKEWAGEGGV